jgi:hypothetical protein
LHPNQRMKLAARAGFRVAGKNAARWVWLARSRSRALQLLRESVRQVRRGDVTPLMTPGSRLT